MLTWHATSTGPYRWAMIRSHQLSDLVTGLTMYLVQVHGPAIDLLSRAL